MLISLAVATFKTREDLVLENLALRQQIEILQRTGRHPRATKADRVFWVALSKVWSGWRDALVVFTPATVVGWHRKGFKLFWTWKSRVLFVFVLLRHDRRSIVHFGVTAHPTSAWTGQQLVEAFPWNQAPRYQLHDRDAIYGNDFRRRVHGMGINEVRTAFRPPWQNPYCERLIGTIRRECLGHVVVLNEAHLQRLLASYADYYHTARTHLSLDKDAPIPRTVHPPEGGTVTALPMIGGLHHQYVRCDN
jgi:transposase InsO family protein